MMIFIFRPACASGEASLPPGRRELVRSVSTLSISFLKINQKSVSRFLTRRIRGKKVFTRKLFFQSCWFFSRLDRKSLMITGPGMRRWELWLYAVKCYVMHANKNKYYLSEHGLTNNKIKLCHKTRNFKPFDESECFCCKLKLND